MSERALVKPAIEPYAEIIPESQWGTWTKNNLNYYTDYYGYTLIENYEPSSNDEDELI